MPGLEPPQGTQPLSPMCQSSSELRAVPVRGHLDAPRAARAHPALPAWHLIPHSLPFPGGTRVNHRAEQWGVANPNCAGPQSPYGGKV